MSLEQKFSELKSTISDKNLLTHFQDIFAHLLTSSLSSDIFSKFEDISLQVKTSQEEKYSYIRENYEDIKVYIEQLKALLIKPVAEGEGEAQEGGPIGYVPNFIEESRLFSTVGISFGEDESYIIFKSLTKLAQAKNSKQLRLWGKILCSEKDYYIVEALVDGGDDGELAPGTEPRGTGANKYAYFATNDLLGGWTDLPLVTPDQIKLARQIKYMFTGNLEKKVVSNPHFNGLEKNLLRAQIARISQSTQLVTTGIYKVNEDDSKQIDPIEQDENYKAPTFEQLCSLDNWHHFSENLLQEGRIVHNKPEIPEGQDEEQFMKLIETNDPFEPRLKAVSKDVSKEGLPEAWVIGVQGDASTYMTQDLKKSKNNGIIVIKSQVWKGFTLIYQDKFQQSLYVGYGFKSDQKLFYPKCPQMMNEEPADRDDQPEPREQKSEQQQEVKQEEEA